MSDKVFNLEVVTPERIVFKGEVTSISVPGALGGFQVLHSHAPLLSLLVIGGVKILELNGAETHYAISGGFFEVHENNAVLLAETAERINEIDTERAKAALDRAVKRIAKKKPDIDIERAKLAYSRASNRLRIAGTH